MFGRVFAFSAAIFFVQFLRRSSNFLDCVVFHFLIHLFVLTRNLYCTALCSNYDTIVFSLLLLASTCSAIFFFNLCLFPISVSRIIFPIFRDTFSSVFMLNFGFANFGVRFSFLHDKRKLRSHLSLACLFSSLS